MKLGSLFDGVGGWQLAGVRNGIKPVWSSEIETFPREVTKRRFPETKQLGDIRNINGAEIEPVEIITAGFPCQNLSQAGNRQGVINGTESGLFFDAVRVIRQMRVSTCGVYPKVCIFENVTGALSSNQGMDFRIILEQLTDTEVPIPRSGRWASAGLVRGGRADVGWRVLNSKFFGVAQSRRRVWIVQDFTKNGCAEKILFEQKGLSGIDSQRSGQRYRSASTVEKSIRATNRVLNEGGNTIVKIRSGKDDGTAGKGALIGVEESFALSCTNDQFLFQVYDMTHCDDVIREYHNEAPTLNARMGTGGNQVPILLERRYAVRKMTPLELERLQGLPDGWTLIDDKSCSDSARYKALGNGMSQPVPDWLLKRLVDVLGDKNENPCCV